MAEVASSSPADLSRISCTCKLCRLKSPVKKGVFIELTISKLLEERVSHLKGIKDQECSGITE